MSKKNIKVLHVTACKYPPEIRVIKEAKSQLKGGYEVAVLCPPYGNQPEKEVCDGVQVFRPSKLASLPITDKLLYNIFFVSPSWRAALRSVLSEYKPDVIQVHDIWLGRSVYSERSNEKIILDLHENMPGAVVEYLKGYKGLTKVFNFLFKNFTRIRNYEYRLLSKADMVLVVVQEAYDRLVRYYPQLDKNKIRVVDNLESKSFSLGSTTLSQDLYRNRYNILYIGGFGPHRGLETLIKALPYLRNAKVDAHLYLIGAKGQNAYLEILQSLIAKLNVADLVTIIDWVPFDHVAWYIKNATIVTVPHFSNEHTNNTIPHKLFQYMIMEKPVLVSDSTPLKRVVDEAHSGYVFEAGNAADCADKILKMIAATNLDQLGRNGFDYVINKGNNWEDSSETQLLQAMELLIKK